MTCRDFIDFLLDYVSEQLTPEERAIFDAHLAECPACVAYLDSYRETVKLGKAALATPDENGPEAAPEELVRAILASRPKLGRASDRKRK